MSKATNPITAAEAPGVVERRWFEATQAATAAGLHITCLATDVKETPAAWYASGMIFTTAEAIFSPKIGQIIDDLCKQHAAKTGATVEVAEPVLEVPAEIDGGF